MTSESRKSGRRHLLLLILGLGVLVVVIAGSLLPEEKEADDFVPPERPSGKIRYGSVDREEWNSLDLTGTRFKKSGEFLTEVDWYFETIGTYVYRDDWPGAVPRVTIRAVPFYFEDGGSWTDIMSVNLDRFAFEHDAAPIAHEITHIIAFTANYSIMEGFACYCQDRFGKSPDFCNWGQDIHAVAKLFLRPEYQEVWENTGHWFYEATQDQSDPHRSLAYILGHSYVTYLIDEYGLKAVSEFFGGTGMETHYYRAFSRSYDNVKSGWISFIENYEPALSDEELIENMRRAILSRGFSGETADVYLYEYTGAVS